MSSSTQAEEHNKIHATGYEEHIRGQTTQNNPEKPDPEPSDKEWLNTPGWNGIEKESNHIEEKRHMNIEVVTVMNSEVVPGDGTGGQTQDNSEKVQSHESGHHDGQTEFQDQENGVG